MPYRKLKTETIYKKMETRLVKRRKHELWHELVGNMHPRTALSYFITLYQNRSNIDKQKAEIIFNLVGYRDFEEAVKYVMKYFIHSEVVREFQSNIWCNNEPNNNRDRHEVCPDLNLRKRLL